MLKIFIFISLAIVHTTAYNSLCVKPGLERLCIKAKCFKSLSPKTCVNTTTAYVGGNQCCDEAMIKKLLSGGVRGTKKRRSVAMNRQKRQAYNFDKYPASMWKMPIKYYFNDTITETMRVAIGEAIRIIEEVTCVRFLLATTQPAPSNNDPYLAFSLDKSCVSFVGKSADQISPILGTADCLNKTGTVLYLITQSLGLWHQTQRPDSVLHVTVHTESLNPAHNGDFLAINSDDLLTFGYPYDLASVMSFPPKVYSLDGRTTISTVDSGFKNTIGQRAEYSFQDSKLVNKLYCEANCPTKLECSNGGYTNPTNCNHCYCPDGYTGVLCNSISATSTSLVNENDCGGELIAKYQEKFITSPGYISPGFYPLNSTCIWHIKGENVSRIRLKFVDEFGLYIDPLSACQHWVEVKHTLPLNATGYRYCDTNLPNATMLANSNDVIVVFKSKFSDVAIPDRRGFKLSYKLVCGDSTCANGGTCSNEVCNCRAGYYGLQCEQGGTTICETNPCQNNGTCVMSSSSNFTCQCPPSFTGNFCQTPVTNTSCSPNPCKNNGTCVALSSTSYKCYCAPAFFGYNCQNANCGGCNISPGVRQSKCCSTVKQTCYRIVYQTRPGFYPGSNVRRRVVQNYPCANESRCCDNAVEFTDGCYVIGWSAYGPCSKSCGSGVAQQQRFDIVWQNNISYYQVVETRTVQCNQFNCTSSFSSSSDDQSSHGHYGHHWFNIGKK